MGTNYYLHMDVCDCCGRGDKALHIGKSSGGWCFSLHVDPYNNINTLEDWVALWDERILGGIDGKLKYKNIIKNEYDEPITPSEMLAIITERNYEGRDWNTPPSCGYASWEDFHYRNYSEQGPNGLIRHKIDEFHCIGHGEGPWDFVIGEFS